MKFRNYFIALLALLGFACPALAHPHEFVAFTAEVRATQEKISQINITLSYDKITSKGRIANYDDDETGTLTASQLAGLLRSENLAYAQSEYFIAIQLGKNLIAPKSVKLTSCKIIDNCLEFNMQVDVAIPISRLEKNVLEIYVEDPSMYVKFFPNFVESAAPVIKMLDAEWSGEATPIKCELVEDPDAILIGLSDKKLQASKELTFFGRMRALQAKYNRYFREQITWVRDNFSGAGALFMLFALAVGLGFIHAAAPGHGKSIAAAYFANRPARKRQAFVFGTIVAGMHTGTAIALTGVIYYIRKLGTQLNQKDFVDWINFVLALIFLLAGLVLLTLWVKRLFSKSQHHEEVAPEKIQGKRLVPAAVAGGLIPCPLSILILTVFLATNNFGLGVIIVLGIATGTAALISLAGLLVLIGRKKMLDKLDEESPARRRFHKFLDLATAGFVILLGLGLLTLYTPKTVSDKVSSTLGITKYKPAPVDADQPADASEDTDADSKAEEEDDDFIDADPFAPSEKPKKKDKPKADEDGVEPPAPGEDPLNLDDEVF